MVVWSSFSRCAQLSSVFRQAGVAVPNNGKLNSGQFTATIHNVLCNPNTRAHLSTVLQICKRESSHGPKMMHITPSRFQFHKFKDMLHFFTVLGLIPVGALVFYANVFVGPATLTPKPDGYEPQHWEYHRVHPFPISIATATQNTNRSLPRLVSFVPVTASYFSVFSSLRVLIAATGIREIFALFVRRNGQGENSPIRETG